MASRKQTFIYPVLSVRINRITFTHTVIKLLAMYKFQTFECKQLKSTAKPFDFIAPDTDYYFS